MTRHNEYNQRSDQEARPDITPRRYSPHHIELYRASVRPTIETRFCSPEVRAAPYGVSDISLSRENLRPKIETQFCSPEVLAAPHVVPGYVIILLRPSGNHFRPITLEKRLLRYDTGARVFKSYDRSHTYSATTRDGLWSQHRQRPLCDPRSLLSCPKLSRLRIVYPKL